MALKVVLVGGSGFLGSGLQARLTAAGDAVTVIGRSLGTARNGVRFAPWDGQSLGHWVAALEGADVVVHLAGGSDPALALTGRKCVPARLLREGHEFRETDIDGAVSKAVNVAT